MRKLIGGRGRGRDYSAMQQETRVGSGKDAA